MSRSRAIWLALAAEGIIILLATAIYGQTLEALEVTTRFSGRLSLLVFSLIFILYPYQHERLVRWLSADYLLIMALVHFIHLIELLSFLHFSGAKPVPYRLAGGMLAYAIIMVAPWVQHRVRSGQTTADFFAKLMRAYLGYVWFIFLMTYISRVSNGTIDGGKAELLHIILLAFTLLLMVYRAVEWIRNK